MLDPVSDRLPQRSLNNVFREANEAGLVLALRCREQVVPDCLELADIRQRGGRRLVVGGDVAGEPGWTLNQVLQSIHDMTREAGRVERPNELPRGLKPVGGVLGQGLEHDPLEGSGYIRVELSQRRWMVLDDLSNHIVDRSAGERPNTPQRFVEHNAEGEHVCSRIHGFASRLLRSHVPRRAPNHAGRSPGGFTWRERKPEIRHENSAVPRNENVAWFDVAMDDSTPVRVFQRQRDLADDSDGNVRRERTATGKNPGEGIGVRKFQCQIRNTVRHARVVDWQNVPVVEFPQCSRLAQPWRQGCVVSRRVLVKGFQRDDLACGRVESAIDRRRSPATEESLNLISAVNE